MKELKIVVEDKEYIHQLPENFNEMTGEQIIEAIKFQFAQPSDLSPSFIKTMCGVSEENAKLLSRFHLYSIAQQFDFLREKDWDVSFKEQKFLKINIGNTECYGYFPNFGNTTWEEFIWADQYFMDNNYRMLIACLYRQKRENYNGETDVRIPFTNYGITKRLQEVNKLDEATILALALQYKAMRVAALEEKYTAIFPYHEKLSEEETEEEPQEKTESTDNNFSWVKVHQNLMGDNIVHEQSYLKLNIHTVLNRLNNAIIESRKRKK